MYTQIHIRTRALIQLHTRTHVCRGKQQSPKDTRGTYICTHIHTYTHTHVDPAAYTHRCVYMHTYIHIYVYTHVQKVHMMMIAFYYCKRSTLVPFIALEFSVLRYICTHIYAHTHAHAH